MLIVVQIRAARGWGAFAFERCVWLEGTLAVLERLFFSRTVLQSHCSRTLPSECGLTIKRRLGWLLPRGRANTLIR